MFIPTNLLLNWNFIAFFFLNKYKMAAIIIYEIVIIISMGMVAITLVLLLDNPNTLKQIIPHIISIGQHISINKKIYKIVLEKDIFLYKLNRKI